MNGKVKFFNGKKGFGFIAGEDGNSYFLVWKNLNKSILSDPKQKRAILRGGAPVIFEPGEVQEKGPLAANVRLDETA